VISHIANNLTAKCFAGERPNRQLSPCIPRIVGMAAMITGSARGPVRRVAETNALDIRSALPQ
jgi:hypothetical protein